MSSEKQIKIDFSFFLINTLFGVTMNAINYGLSHKIKTSTDIFI